jgi:hypothetical protein
MWERVDSLADEINKVWLSTADRDNLRSLVNVLRNMQSSLRHWSKNNFGAMTGELDKLRRELEEVKARTVVSRADIHVITDRMDELLYHEEMMWLQRSRISWLKEGDRNTGFFHRQARWWARKNKIRILKKVDGTWSESPQGMKEMALSFFGVLYYMDDEVVPDMVLDHIEPKVSESMNDDLCKVFSEKEISDAMFQMGPLKAPGPDGFLARFYQKRWGIVKDDIVVVVQKFFLDGVLPERLNDTTIVLIPKD